MNRKTCSRQTCCRQTLLVALCLAALPGLASAGVVTPAGAGLPPVKPVTNLADSSATQPAASHTATAHQGANGHGKSTVPAISPEASAASRAAQVWQQSIATPPEGPESTATKNLAKQALAASQAMDNTLPVVGGLNGTVISLAGRPVLVCSPLHTCIIELPDSVKPVTTVGVSPSEWTVQQAIVGKQPEVFVSPKFAGLHQNIVIAATDHGRPVNYEVRLVSDAVRYLPALKIEDSGGAVRSWNPRSTYPGKGFTGQPLNDHKGKNPRVLPLPNIRINHIDLDWSIHCSGGGWFSVSDCKPIRPLRVYDDGTHTFIAMPQGLASHGGFPILQARNASGHLIGVDTQIRGSSYVVDSVPAEIQLRLGSEVVTIKKEGK